MQVSVLKRDNHAGYLYKMLFQRQIFTDEIDIMPFVREHHGYTLGDEFLILSSTHKARRVKIVQGDITPSWVDV